MKRKPNRKASETDRRLSAMAAKTDRLLAAHESGYDVDQLTDEQLDLVPIGGRLLAVPKQRDSGNGQLDFGEEKPIMYGND